MKLVRVRGKVGQFEDGPDQGKWIFEIFISPFGSGDATERDMIGRYGPFETEREAHKEMKRAARLCCEAIEKDEGFKPSGKYIDMKSNLVRRWDGKGEN